MPNELSCARFTASDRTLPRVHCAKILSIDTMLINWDGNKVLWTPIKSVLFPCFKIAVLTHVDEDVNNSVISKSMKRL